MEKYIVLWNENGEKRWERIEKDKLFDFMKEKNAANNKDTMIFRPSFKLKITEDEETIGFEPPEALTDTLSLLVDDDNTLQK